MMKPGRRYAKGRRLEYKTIAFVKERHRRCRVAIIRSAGSHGPFDVTYICFDHREVRAYQVKSRKPSSRELRQWRKQYGKAPGVTWAWGVSTGVHVWKPRAKSPLFYGT